METRGAVSKDVLAEKLEEARERTRFLLGPVSEEDLARPARPDHEPPDLGLRPHRQLRGAVAAHKAHGKVLSKRELYDMYDASLHPREERPSLNLLDRKDADSISMPSARLSSIRWKTRT
jgi:iron(II)-dependent oxidoreductase